MRAPGYARAHSAVLDRPVREWDWGGLTILEGARPSRGWATWEDWFEAACLPAPRQAALPDPFRLHIPAGGRRRRGGPRARLPAADRRPSRVGRAGRGRRRLRRCRPPPIHPAHRTRTRPARRPAMLRILRRSHPPHGRGLSASGRDPPSARQLFCKRSPCHATEAHHRAVPSSGSLTKRSAGTCPPFTSP